MKRRTASQHQVLRGMKHAKKADKDDADKSRPVPHQTERCHGLHDRDRDHRSALARFRNLPFIDLPSGSHQLPVSRKGILDGGDGINEEVAGKTCRVKV